MTHGKPAEIDVVELTAPAGRWPAGTVGTVVSVSDERFALVEVSRERDGATRDTLRVPYDGVRVTWRARELA